MSVADDIRKTLHYAGRNGLRDTWHAAAERLREKSEERTYVRQTPSAEQLRAQKNLWESLLSGGTPSMLLGAEYDTGRSGLPMISVLVPAYETDEVYLHDLIDSMLAQTWGNWELIVADAGVSETVRAVVTEYSADMRIKYHKLPENGGISRNTNAAAIFAQGDYVAFLDHDDFLEPDALFEAALAIMRTDCEVLYTDEDKCDAAGQHFYEPNRKPDYNADYFFSNNYICHLLMIKRGLFLALKLRSEYDGAQDYDLVLRAPKSEIVHVPKILYHWRAHPGSTAEDPGHKDYATEAGRAALQDFFDKSGIPAKVAHSRHRGFYDVTYEPDIFHARPEVGVIGGRIADRHHRIVGGQYDEHGNVVFEGMNEYESGPMHRADTRADVYAVDVRCMEIREELEALYEQVFRSSYAEHVFHKGTDYRSASVEFCRRAAGMGYLIVWEPGMRKTV
ncbi:MAG: glycosyltransferase [Lachnospiraceae bacterium]|jgi:glycosyltransferase involved in cell wall biosynthesis|nr:glycosyltransferase [Lachnospiraceae bacterium]